MKENTTERDNTGLGDMVEKLIKTVLPKVAEMKKDCISCKKKKDWLNNVGAKFS